MDQIYRFVITNGLNGF